MLQNNIDTVTPIVRSESMASVASCGSDVELLHSRSQLSDQSETIVNIEELEKNNGRRKKHIHGTLLDTNGKPPEEPSFLSSVFNSFLDYIMDDILDMGASQQEATTEPNKGSSEGTANFNSYMLN